MKPMFWIAVLLVVFIPSMHAAGLGSNELALARQQATNSLDAFRGLLTPANYKLMGFNSTNEAAQATNGAPILIYRVPLAALQSFHGGQDFSTLLQPAPLVIVPVLFSGEVRSSIILRYESATQGQWKNVSWGQPELIQSLMTVYRAIPSSRVDPAIPPFVVEIPSLNIWLVGYTSVRGDAVLHATREIRLGPLWIHQNQVITDAAMTELSTMAQRHNGLPN